MNSMDMKNLLIIYDHCNETLYVPNKQNTELSARTNWLSRKIEWLLDAFSGGERSKKAKNLVIETLKQVSLSQMDKNMQARMGNRILSSKLGEDEEIKAIVKQRFFPVENFPDKRSLLPKLHGATKSSQNPQ